MKKTFVFLLTTTMLSVMVGCGPSGCGVNMNATLDNDQSQESDKEVSNTQESTIQTTQETNIDKTVTKITKEEAESIALKHANVTLEEVTYLYSIYEIDDGIPQYDVNFRKGYIEYDYEIHAETGKIISFEQD